MNYKQPYRIFLAALLLLVYAFIIFPVGLLHHHETPTTSSKNSEREYGGVVVSKGSAHVACSVCDHKYSVYDDAVFSTFVLTVAAYSVQNAWYLSAVNYPPFLSFTNKGPPAIG